MGGWASLFDSCASRRTTWCNLHRIYQELIELRNQKQNGGGDSATQLCFQKVYFIRLKEHHFCCFVVAAFVFLCVFKFHRMEKCKGPWKLRYISTFISDMNDCPTETSVEVRKFRVEYLNRYLLVTYVIGNGIIIFFL